MPKVQYFEFCNLPMFRYGAFQLITSISFLVWCQKGIITNSAIFQCFDMVLVKLDYFHLIFSLIPKRYFDEICNLPMFWSDERQVKCFHFIFWLIWFHSKSKLLRILQKLPMFWSVECQAITHQMINLPEIRIRPRWHTLDFTN